MCFRIILIVSADFRRPGLSCFQDEFELNDGQSTVDEGKRNQRNDDVKAGDVWRDTIGGFQ